MKTFAAGVATGMALVAATAAASGLLRWNRLDIDAANVLFANRSGLTFSALPPDPCRGGACTEQTLTVQASPVTGLHQTVEVNPGPTQLPPDPCFTATLEAGSPTVAVTVLHPDQLSLVDANGNALALCDANGGGVGTAPPAN
ncbi:MAG TPA: hypothetical protein VLX92_27935 [Kofleriaceae bacterium]|nr:hypothetical protein [Kofleriaceae bacterium]